MVRQLLQRLAQAFGKACPASHKLAAKSRRLNHTPPKLHAHLRDSLTAQTIPHEALVGSGSFHLPVQIGVMTAAFLVVAYVAVLPTGDLLRLGEYFPFILFTAGTALAWRLGAGRAGAKLRRQGAPRY
jgi:hypothetical protein